MSLWHRGSKSTFTNTRGHARLLTLVCPLMIVLLALPGHADTAETSSRDSLSQKVAQLRSAAGIPKASISVSIRDATDDRLLVSRYGSRPMIPASNMKLFTTGMALDLLGADYSFQTELYLDGDDLRVLGDGDPGLADPVLLEQTTWTDANGVTHHGLDVPTLLSTWVSSLQKQGVGSIDELIIDDRVFERIRVHPDWPSDQLNRRYCAEVSGLNFHLNVMHFFPTPGSTRPSFARHVPDARWIRYENKATSRKGPKDKQTVWIARAPGGNLFQMRGNVRSASVEPVPVTITDPSMFMGRLLAQQLGDAGITVRTVRKSRMDEAVTGTVVGSVIRTPIRTSLRRCNTDSQNLHTESLLKRADAQARQAPGSWEGARETITRVLENRIGRELAAQVRLSDGSGPSRSNRITTDAMTAWLASLYRDTSIRDAFVESLATAGKGTLRKRFAFMSRTNAKLYCKTGYINGVSTLSGYVIAPSGRCICFSILCNDLRSGTAPAKKFQENVVKAIVDHLGIRIGLVESTILRAG
ncbi:MAG: D-alanyl-D-alanine carboxypeptidase/D-alanyl-D-alanine-endopeptidase [Phycisphaerae bacterium]|nr:D-alanyl-D-alanine carboxypeptidase/D-alanyl-D-alanine-endopeptidase [Phycisphaerae bacterium]